jgi:2,4-dienoyl-CoA reductase-like NADH-dependent reductase (Old Yellow Enzyme family)
MTFIIFPDAEEARMPVQALFKPFHLGSLELPTRVVMAPMTRSFSPGGVPNSKVIEYYRRRAAAGVGLIITEGTTVGHKASNGYPNVPRFFGADALDGWRKVVEAVHEEGGKIVPQLWHVGAVRRLGTEPDGAVPAYGPTEKLKDGKVVVQGHRHGRGGNSRRPWLSGRSVLLGGL